VAAPPAHVGARSELPSNNLIWIGVAALALLLLFGALAAVVLFLV
jgi:hypothetical protein